LFSHTPDQPSQATSNSLDFSTFQSFYSAYPLHHKQVKFSSKSLEKQIELGLQYNNLQAPCKDTNSYLPLLSTCEFDISPDSSSKYIPPWKLSKHIYDTTMSIDDTDLSTLTNLIAQQLQKDQDQLQLLCLKLTRLCHKNLRV
jgi:hypothetical protein